MLLDKWIGFQYCVLKITRSRYNCNWTIQIKVVDDPSCTTNKAKKFINKIKWTIWSIIPNKIISIPSIISKFLHLILSSNPIKIISISSIISKFLPLILSSIPNKIISIPSIISRFLPLILNSIPNLRNKINSIPNIISWIIITKPIHHSHSNPITTIIWG